jgi:hypothetical protein
MAENPGAYSHFRLNFEQQQKRAKELLRAARSGDAGALQRFATQPPRLAEAQYLIARELRFENWAALKAHVTAMQRERAAMEAASADRAMDADLRTLHLRCGSDIQAALVRAGFQGEFCEHSYPYLIGPVREGAGCLEQRAQFLADSYGSQFDPPLTRDGALQGLLRDEQRLRDSANYERVVIWSEHDCYDQLVLLRLLGHYAAQRQPPLLELINVGGFPGGARFIGLGQLPPEALRLLWAQRQPATAAQLALGLAGWKALASEDPRPLAAIMRSGSPSLPLLAPALHRHLRELPARQNGLGFTQQLVLEMLAIQPHSLNRLFGRLAYGVDPLPGQGDAQMRDRVLPMGDTRRPLFTRTPGVDAEGRARPPWTDVYTITGHGQAVLRGAADFLADDPPPRWVGGVEIGQGRPDWRWDEARRDAVLATAVR